MNKPVPVILDADPGHDDAIAWVVANASKDLKILACTAVNGNCNVHKAQYNARRVMTLIGLNAPVAAGRNCPLYRESLSAPANIHGESGLDGPALPEPVMELEECSAVELMARTLKNSDEPVTIVATGPLTNVAQLLLAHPELKNRIARISLMGGGIKYGNWTPAAEFNILFDPEAADIVFSSGIPIIMAGLDVTEKALIKPEDVEAIKAISNPVSEIVWQWLEFFYRFHLSIGYRGAPMHDVCAVMALIHPEVFTMQSMYVKIETSGMYTTGKTVGDIYNVTGIKPNATCLIDVDRPEFVRLLTEYIRCYSEVQ
ncbi:MAG: nucleoside hydrolase [Erysipelotrichaceae bacterium]|nr:nucleoside hydrolase [Erysipelotrichaceae bacterium]